MDYGKYTLIYENGGYKYISEFDGDIDLYTLSDYLRYFLLGVSWLPKQVDELLGEQI